MRRAGPERAAQLLGKVIVEARLRGRAACRSATARPYVNTIHSEDEEPIPGDPEVGAPPALGHPLERGGHGAAGQQGVERARRPHRQLPVGGDAVRGRLQPLLARAAPSTTAATSSTSRGTPRRASTPARSWRAASARSSCSNFRQEVGGNGLSSYPHPWLMPDFWQFPTVSMGLGPIMAIYQARFLKYLQGRGIAGHRGPQGVGVHGRRRDGRAGVDGRDLARRPREPRQPDLRRQLQPAAPRRPGARQRQDHPGARDQLPRRRLERDQGDLGRELGPAPGRRPRRPAEAADGPRPWTASTRRSSRATAPTCASTSSAPTRSCRSGWRT